MFPTSSDQTCEETSIIVIGGGPTGALLSALLGRMNIPNVVLEKTAEITTDPRGIALDEDGIRLLQSVGLYDRVFTRIGACRDMHFISGMSKDLAKTPFLMNTLSTTEGGTGHVGFVFHKQPEMEKGIRDIVAECGPCDFRTEATLVAIEEDDEEVTVEYADAKGNRRRLRAPFLVGADGKTGFVRKQYLEPKGVLLESCEGTSYNETWVAQNLHLTVPTPTSHPEFPLWALNYTPEQVYDAFFPSHFSFLCNPSRPSVCGRFGLDSDRLWRFEFVVQPGEDPEDMASPDGFKKIVYPYLTHPGNRYGLQDPVSFPSDCIETLRSRPFTFSARSCNRWAQGRVIIAGDAAHVFPPFGGQGIASGFRDASALAWRLALLHREPETDHHALLKAWYKERKQQFDASLALTIRNGEFVTNANPVKAFVRDWMLWGVQLVPAWRRGIQNGGRGKMTRYRYEDGMAFVEGRGGGLMLPQVFALDFREQRVRFTDDLIFPPGKQGLFHLLVLVDRSVEVADALLELDGIARISRGRVREDEATVLIHDLEAQLPIPSDTTSTVNVARIATGDEFAADAILSRNRPPPDGYDAFKLRREVGATARFVVLRPDRVVYAACVSGAELKNTLKRLDADLHVKDAARSSSVNRSSL